MVAERLRSTLGALGSEPRLAVAIAGDVHGQPLSETNASWFLQETLCYLQHLEREGRVAQEPDGETTRWRLG